MPSLSWYRHRLQAMSLREAALHVRDRLRHLADARLEWKPGEDDPGACGAFPHLRLRSAAPPELRDALRRDTPRILAGHWIAFGHLPLDVGDPPRWHRDSRTGILLDNTRPAFVLDRHRPPPSVDLKIVWEPNRWYSLTRLAMAAYVLAEAWAARKCIEWLENWVEHNPPYRGWNWTSTLEVGVRLTQFTWIDALLTAWGALEPDAGRPAATELEMRLRSLRRAILPRHVRYAWRHLSFGTSANNHLVGELAGLILATSRWPGLARWCAPLETLQARWEHEVLAQFAEDGGHREQALGYHLSAWQFCWEARRALESTRRVVSPLVEARLERAAEFLMEVQVSSDAWDYGDSDGAVGTPFAANELQAMQEWHRWLADPGRSAAIEFWVGGGRAPRPPRPRVAPGWRRFEPSGQAMWHADGWTLRWDLSPLGMGSTAAHAHLDALHVSLWFSGVALVVDPGTGAYADEALRNWLSSAEAHNVIVPIVSAGSAWPRRLGPFLWQRSSVRPRRNPGGHTASLALRGGWEAARSIDAVAGCGVVVTDAALHRGRPGPFRVRWQFAPGARLEDAGGRCFRIDRLGVRVQVRIGPAWARVTGVTDPSRVLSVDPGASLAGIVSPAFHQACWAPYLLLEAPPDPGGPDGFTTTFTST